MNILFAIKSAFVLGYVVVGVVSILFFAYALRRFFCKQRPVLTHVSNSVVMPLTVLIIWYGLQKMFGLCVQFQELQHVPELLLWMKQDFDLIARVIDVVLVAWLLYRCKMAFQEYALICIEKKEWDLDPMSFTLMSKFITMLSLAVLLFVTLNIFGVELHSLVMFGSALSLAIGFASQTAAANFVGGLMVYVTGAFKEGEWIGIPEKDLEGTVEEIGWYITRIKNLDHRPIFVPNSVFIQAVVVNMTRMYHRHIKARIGVRYTDISVLQQIVTDIKDMLAKHEGIAHDQRCMVHWVEFGQYALELEIYAYTKATKLEEFRAVQQQVFHAAYAIIKAHGAQIAMPAHEVHVNQLVK